MNTPEEKRPRLFLYSLVLPAFWFGVGIFMQTFFPGKRLGQAGLFVMLTTVVWLVSWHFASTFGRHMSRSEKIRLIAYCTLWAISVELLALYSYVIELRASGKAVLDATGMFWVVAITMAFDTLLIWAAFTYMARRFIDARLRKIAARIT